MESVIAVLADYTVKPILHQLSYLFYYNENTKQLEEHLKTLESTRDGVKILVGVEKGKGNAILPHVTKWLDDVEKEVINEGRSSRSNPSCFNFIKRHQVSREAKKRMENIGELINEGKRFGKDNNIGYPVPCSDTQSTTLPNEYQIINSRTTIAKQIKDALVDPNINTVGVWGMGGVGKSELLNQVQKLVLETNLFDLVIKVEIGQSKSVNEIQDEIGNKLNMELKGKSDEVRASRLRTYIAERKENILFMLDDLWNEYDLEHIGIPFRSKTRKDGCKIVMASRNRDILENQMNAEKLILVDLLSEEESWKFFVTIVGEFVDQGKETIAKKVVNECGRLPIALKIVGKVLKGKPIDSWRDAFNRLTNHAVMNIQGVSDKLYSCLRLSYDSIENEVEAKSLFLLCSVFPDDHKIYVGDLQMYAMGLGLLDHLITWKDAKCRVFKLVTDLKSSYLLLDSDEGDDYVQMHDVVRDVAKYIALKIDKRMSSLSIKRGEWQEEYRSGSYHAIFVNCKGIPNLPPKLEFSNLELLILRIGYRWMENNSQIPDSFFQGIKKLRVLDVENINFERQTKAFHSLNNLETLCMYDCVCNDFDTIGQLKKLKILKIIKCSIKELPASMCELTELKVLEVSCIFLNVIPSNIISSMKRLEKLSLWGSHFQNWEKEVSYKNKLIKNVELSELNGLTRLYSLSIEVPNVDMLSNELSLERAEKLEEFFIFVGDICDWNLVRFNKYTTKTLVLNIDQSPIMCSIGGLLEKLVQNCENLFVRDSVGFAKLLCNLNPNYVYPHLKYLKIWIKSDMPCSSTIENITPFFYRQVSFPELKKLSIKGENNSEKFWHNNGLSENSFCKLQQLSITGCNKVRCVFHSHMVTSLVLLKVLRVSNCELLETIFEFEKEEQRSDVVKLLSLTILELRFLPNLKHVYNNDPIHDELGTFPNLKQVKIHRCHHLKILFPLTFIKHMDKIESIHVDHWKNEIFAEEEASKLVFQDQNIVLFPYLSVLAIHCKHVEKGRFWVRSETFPKLQSLQLFGSKDDFMVSLPLEISDLLYSIEEFKIQNAFKLVQIFQGGEQDQNNHNRIRRAKLKILELNYLPKLTHVWEDNTQMIPRDQFDSLQSISVEGCKNLKYVLPSSITFFNLGYLMVDKCSAMMNLFSSAVAKSLVNLSTMIVERCRGMTYIIVAEGGKGREEEVIIFKKLNYLKLHNLERMVNFHSEKCTLEFPNLLQLVICGCPQMKTFSDGILSTPRFPEVQTDNSFIRVTPTHGINHIIQQMWKDKCVNNLLTQQCEDNAEESDSEEREEIFEVYQASSDDNLLI